MKRIGLYLFIIGITFIKAYGQELMHAAQPWEVPVWRFRG